jgi:hypothetical protein
MSTTSWYQGNGPYVKNRPIVETVPGEVRGGVVQIVPSDGWHWNAKYPFQFMIRNIEGSCVTGSSIYTAVAPDRIWVTFDVLTSEPCERILAVRAKFSLCSESACRVIKDEFEIRVYSNDVHQPVDNSKKQ